VDLLFVSDLAGPADRPLWISGDGARLRDEAGRTLILRSAAWYGLETRPWIAGLPKRSYRTRRITVDGRSFEQKGVLEDIRDLGFNSIRFAICQDVADPGWSIAADPGRMDRRYNPDFFDAAGRPVSALAMLTLLCDHCRTLGLRVILDMHCAQANGSNVFGNTGLWYTTQFPDSPAGSPHFARGPAHLGPDPSRGPGRNERQFFEAWKALARHFRNNSAVCAFDLVNEPYWGIWEPGSVRASHNLRFMYERLGNELHAINPNLFLWLEGPADAGFNPETGAIEIFHNTPRFARLSRIGSPHWGTIWASNLRQAGRHPPAIRRGDKFGYSPHEYGHETKFQVFDDAKRTFQGYTMPLAEALPLFWGENWGYLAEDGIKPLWIGEWSAPTETPANDAEPATLRIPADRIWIDSLAAYCRRHAIGHCFFSINAADHGDRPWAGWFRGQDWSGWGTPATNKKHLFAGMFGER